MRDRANGFSARVAEQRAARAPGLRAAAGSAALAAALLAPGAPRWASAFPEYPSGVAGRIRCLVDCALLGWGAFRPRTERIRLEPSPRLTVRVPPFRVDRRALGGMSECASIADNGRGTVLVAWMLRDPRDGQPYKIYARRLDPSGRAVGPDFRVNTGPSAGLLVHHPSIRSDGAGRFAVVWHAAPDARRLVRGGAGVFLRRFEADGRPGPELRVSPAPSGEMPEMAVGPRDELRVVWSDRGALWGRVVRSDLSMGAARRLDDTPPGAAAEFPAVACQSDGTALAAWVDTRAGGRDVRGRWFDADFRPRGPSFPIGPGPVPRQFFRLVSVAATPFGVAVLWRRPGTAWGCWLSRSGGRLTQAGPVLRGGAEVALLPRPDGAVWATQSRDLVLWSPGRVGPAIPLLRPPSAAHEMCLAPARDGLWLAWHDAIDARRLPALGDNYYLMAARVAPDPSVVE